MSLSNGSIANSDFIQGQIISRLNLDYLPEEDRIKLLDSMAEVISQRVLLRILAGLPQDKSEMLAGLLDNGNDDEVGRFIEENVSGFLSILQEEIDAVSNELSALIKK